MWRSSWRRVSNFFLNVSSFFLSMIATYDRCHLMPAAKKKSHPTELYPTRSRTNIVSAREIGRQLEGRRKAMSQKHVSGTAKRPEKIVCFPENQGWFAA